MRKVPRRSRKNSLFRIPQFINYLRKRDCREHSLNGMSIANVDPDDLTFFGVR